jgi:hypothetical protein
MRPSSSVSTGPKPVQQVGKTMALLFPWLGPYVRLWHFVLNNRCLEKYRGKIISFDERAK